MLEFFKTEVEKSLNIEVVTFNGSELAETVKNGKFWKNNKNSKKTSRRNSRETKTCSTVW